MTPIVIENRVQYKVEVGQTTYITRQCLANARASAVTGRATRVWEAYPANDATKSVALKDLWMDMDSPSEGEILGDVFKLMEAYKSEHNVTEDYRQFFLTTLDHGIVQIDGKADDTSRAMRGKSLPKTSNYYHTSAEQAFKSTPSNDKDSKGGVPSRSEGAPDCVFLRPRADLRAPKDYRHYRIVFEEVGKPLHELHTLKLAYGALCGAAKGKIPNIPVSCSFN